MILLIEKIKYTSSVFNIIIFKFYYRQNSGLCIAHCAGIANTIGTKDTLSNCSTSTRIGCTGS